MTDPALASTPDPALDPALDLVADALGVSRAALPPDAALGAPGWDSIGHMRLIMALEERLGRELTTDEILGVDGIGRVRALLAAADPNA